MFVSLLKPTYKKLQIIVSFVSVCSSFSLYRHTHWLVCRETGCLRLQAFEPVTSAITSVRGQRHRELSVCVFMSPATLHWPTQGDSFSQHTRFLGHFCNFAFILHFPLDELAAISLLLLLMAVNERSTGRGLASKAATWPQKSSSVVVLAVRTVGLFNIGGNPPGLKLLFMAVFHFALGSPCKASSVQRETRRWPRGKRWKKEERKQTRASDLGVAPS